MVQYDNKCIKEIAFTGQETVRGLDNKTKRLKCKYDKELEDDT